MGKIVLMLKNNFLFQKKVLSVEQFILSKEPSFGEATGKTSSDNFSGRRFFRMNNLLYRKNLLPGRRFFR